MLFQKLFEHADWYSFLVELFFSCISNAIRMLPANMANTVSVAHLIFNVKGPSLHYPISWQDFYRQPAGNFCANTFLWKGQSRNRRDRCSHRELICLKRWDTRQNFGYSTSVQRCAEFRSSKVAQRLCILSFALGHQARLWGSRLWAWDA